MVAEGLGLGLRPWESERLTAPEMAALARWAQLERNREAALAAWLLSSIPYAVTAGIGMAFGNKPNNDWSFLGLLKKAPGYREGEE